MTIIDAVNGNDHLTAVESYFGAVTPTTTGIRDDMRYLFICFTNRCGSNFIANSISSSGYLNMAGEFFNSDAVIRNCRALELKSLSEYFNWLTYREGKNGWLVAKLSIGHVEMLAKAGIFQRISDLSRFIMIDRTDKLAQSISYDVALQTGRWTFDMASRRMNNELEFSHSRLRGVIDAIIAQNKEFADFFEVNNICPTTIIYEKFAENPAFHISLLSQSLGIPDLCYMPARIRLRKQSGTINAEWRERYMAR